MSQFFEPQEQSNAPEFSVSEISNAIKRVVEGEFSHVRIRGELGRLSFPRSGHVYLDLKDERSVLAGVIWKGVAARLSIRPEEGMEVIAVGRISTFGGQSKYQLIIEDLRPAGVGALMAMLEKRKQQFTQEGLFDAARKKQIPYLPQTIGVITSPSGAVIRDILHRLKERFPRHVLLWPVAVQGDKCAPEVSRALEGFNAMPRGGDIPRPDVIIVARGGGSLEDLWGFNEEAVVRAVAKSDIPVISAVGHETDTTLIDYVADLRAPTPTAAAEKAVPVRSDLLRHIAHLGERLHHSTTQSLERRRRHVADLARTLGRPEALIQAPRQRFDFLADRLPQSLRLYTQAQRSKLLRMEGNLKPDTLRLLCRSKHQQLDALAHRLPAAITGKTQERKTRLMHQAQRLSLAPITRHIKTQSRDVVGLGQRLHRAADGHLRDLRSRLDQLGRLQETLGYKATLERGYAVIRSGDLILTRKADALYQEGPLSIEFADGRMELEESASTPAETPPTKHAKKQKPKPSSDSQGSLF